MSLKKLLNPNIGDSIQDINLVTENKPSSLIKFGIIFASLGIVATTIFLHLQFIHVIDFPWYAIWIPVMAISIPCFFHPIGKHYMKEIRIIHKYRDVTISRAKRYFYRGLVIAPFLWFSIFIAAIIIRHYCAEKFNYFHIFVPAQLITLEFFILAHMEENLGKSTKYCFRFSSVLLLSFITFMFIKFELYENSSNFPWFYVFFPLYLGEISVLFDAICRIYIDTNNKVIDFNIFKFVILPFFAKLVLIFSSSVFFVFLTLYLEYGSISFSELFTPLYVFEFFIVLFLIKMSFSRKSVTPQSIN